MATNAVVGLRAGERLLSSTSYYSEVSEKLSCSSSIGFILVPTTSSIVSKKSRNYSHSLVNKRDTQPPRAVKEHVDTATNSSSTDQWVNWVQKFDYLNEEVSEHENAVDALLLLHKSLLEKQWTLSTEETITTEKRSKKVVTGSGVSARRRRLNAQNKSPAKSSASQVGGNKQLSSIISPELLQNYQKGYLKGVKNDALLTHSEVVALSEKIKIGLQLEEEKSR